jgi:hypothetical protein
MYPVTDFESNLIITYKISDEALEGGTTYIYIE